MSFPLSSVRASGCICGKDVRHEGTCVFCGHGIPQSVVIDRAYGLLAAQAPVALDARVVPLRRARSHQWDEDSCVAAYRAWEREHGHPPTSKDWQLKLEPGEHRPSYQRVWRLFGGWKAFTKYVAQVPRDQVAA